jgi:hypothetical protein
MLSYSRAENFFSCSQASSCEWRLDWLVYDYNTLPTGVSGLDLLEPRLGRLHPTGQGPRGGTHVRVPFLPRTQHTRSGSQLQSPEGAEQETTEELSKMGINDRTDHGELPVGGAQLGVGAVAGHAQHRVQAAAAARHRSSSRRTLSPACSLRSRSCSR